MAKNTDVVEITSRQGTVKKLGVDEFGTLRNDGAITLGTGTKTATSTGATTTGSVTLNSVSGKITTPTLTTAALAAHTLTITNSKIAAADQVDARKAQIDAAVPAGTV